MDRRGTMRPETVTSILEVTAMALIVAGTGLAVAAVVTGLLGVGLGCVAAGSTSVAWSWAVQRAPRRVAARRGGGK